MFSEYTKNTLCEICQSAQHGKYHCRRIFCNNELYDFDTIIRDIWGSLGAFYSLPSSCDAVYPYDRNKKFLFIEIKDRDWTFLQKNEEKIKFFKKFYDTLLAIYLYDSQINCSFVISFTPLRSDLLFDSREKSRILAFIKTEFGRFRSKGYYELTGKDIIDFYNKKTNQRINIQNNIILRFKSFEPLACSEIDDYIDKIVNI